MSERSWLDLRNFIVEEACFPPDKLITEDMSVVYSLGQCGDDANEFMEKYFLTFRVDRGDYEFSRYFFMEGEGFIFYFVKKFILRKPLSLKRELMTVGMLYRAIVHGKWDCGVLSEGRFY
ncbi:MULTISPECIES: DUF1493 family protein [Burkholderiaceae]|uniref:DUF1493 family protein n=1 Tax=Burkholderiaceae TaxID=119060 RepID=UPI001423E0CF|nr:MULTISPECIES: DUF1493 family protein [Burkholderiaceae]MBN3847344.1 DUF1493 family protein [Paraburkholderia sp. Ac-20342]NIF56502.1 DUF1493 family protein [Burkholderia sp. Ax-1724]